MRVAGGQKSTTESEVGKVRKSQRCTRSGKPIQTTGYLSFFKYFIHFNKGAFINHERGGWVKFENSHFLRIPSKISKFFLGSPPPPKWKQNIAEQNISGPPPPPKKVMKLPYYFLKKLPLIFLLVRYFKFSPQCSGNISGFPPPLLFGVENFQVAPSNHPPPPPPSRNLWTLTELTTCN